MSAEESDAMDYRVVDKRDNPEVVSITVRVNKEDIREFLVQCNQFGIKSAIIHSGGPE